MAAATSTATPGLLALPSMPSVPSVPSLSSTPSQPANLRQRLLGVREEKLARQRALEEVKGQMQQTVRGTLEYEQIAQALEEHNQKIIALSLVENEVMAAMLNL